MVKPSYRILVVDDEPEIRKFLCASLRARQHEVWEADTGEKALSLLLNIHPDLVILDIGLPDITGIEVTKRLREWSQIPVIILSVRNREIDKIEALDAGADDYLTKPFGVGELMARIRTVLRRGNLIEPETNLEVGDLFLDISRRQVRLAGKEIQLTPTEFDLLKVLMENHGRVMTHRQLIHRVWGTAYEDEGRLLRVNISNLRKKIEPDILRPTYILTEIGVGYRMREKEV